MFFILVLMEIHIVKGIIEVIEFFPEIIRLCFSFCSILFIPKLVHNLLNNCREIACSWDLDVVQGFRVIAVRQQNRFVEDLDGFGKVFIFFSACDYCNKKSQ